jgi:hypothetical protein
MGFQDMGAGHETILDDMNKKFMYVRFSKLLIKAAKEYF